MATLTTIVTGRVADGNDNVDDSINDELFTSAHDTPVFLQHRNLATGSTVVTTLNGVTTYTEGAGDDYTMDDASGAITVLSTGTMADATVYKVDYDFTDYNLAKKINDVTTIADGAGKDYYVYTGTDGQVGVAVIITEL